MLPYVIIMPKPHTMNRLTQVELDSISALIEEYSYLPWKLYLLTFMFNQMPGKRPVQVEIMKREVERVYHRLLNSVHRRANSEFAEAWMPFFVGAPDLGGSSGSTIPVAYNAPNDTLHAHILAGIPLVSRLEIDLNRHFLEYRDSYIKPDHPLERIDVEPIKSNAAYVTGYALKGLKFSFPRDDMIVLRGRDKGWYLRQRMERVEERRQVDKETRGRLGLDRPARG
jgi:hypothetical protein